jgi:predicted DNA-binding protein (MmcQ/YjbR family)
LIASDPGRFFRPPYVGSRGWLGVFLDVEVDWSEIEEIVADAYREVASKSLLARLNKRSSPEDVSRKSAGKQSQADDVG